VKKRPAIQELLRIVARLRSPTGCPWDRQQTHRSLRFHAVEEVYELLDAIEAGDDAAMSEELGDLLLQIVLHCQMARERNAYDFERVARQLAEKLIRRHPHVFGQARADTAAAVWAQWDQIKAAEKQGTRHERHSVLDGIPRHLPALLQAEKLVKKARQAGWLEIPRPPRRRSTPAGFARTLFELVAWAQSRGWSAEDLLRAEIQKRERVWRRRELRSRAPAAARPARRRGLSGKRR
jgi:NTP pyrophosphatase (non-canonical NTP hydrolase)